MNGELRQAAITDPKWAKKEQRREWLLKAVTAGVIVALTVGVLTIVQNRGQDQQITKVTRIQQTPCNRAPAGEACARVRQAVAAAEPLENPCTSYQRVTGKRGKNCDRFYIDVSRDDGASGAGASPAASSPSGRSTSAGGSGGATAPPPQQPGNPSGGTNPRPPKHGSHHSPAPPPSPVPSPTPTQPSSGPGNSDGNGSSEDSEAKPIAEGAGKAIEDIGGSVGGVVKESGESVNKAVEDVFGPSCEVAGVGC